MSTIIMTSSINVKAFWFIPCPCSGVLCTKKKNGGRVPPPAVLGHSYHPGATVLTHELHYGMVAGAVLVSTVPVEVVPSCQVIVKGAGAAAQVVAGVVTGQLGGAK
jgi:hypothetical protein